MTHDIEYIDKMVIGMFSKIKVYFFAKSSIRVGAASDNTIMKIIHILFAWYHILKALNINRSVWQ